MKRLQVGQLGPAGWAKPGPEVEYDGPFPQQVAEIYLLAAYDVLALEYRDGEIRREAPGTS